MYAHQDWKPVIFNTKKQKDCVQVGEKKKLDTGFVSIAKLEDNGETFNHKKVDKHMADAIKNKRIELKMTQSVLAQRINEKPSVIQDVETMKGVYNHIIINKILRALGLSLKGVKNISQKQ
jgi:ribosome-binding protein aMBF1 (putative translation factor)